MTRLTRRRFLGASSTVLAASAVGSFLGCGDQDENAPETSLADQQGEQTSAGNYAWKWAICNEIMQDWDWRKQCEFSAQVGYKGLEVAPFTLAQHVDEVSAARRSEMRDMAGTAGLEVIGLHWLLVTPDWLHFTTPDEDVRKRTWEYMGKLADLCGDLGGSVMIFGSPKQRGSRGISREEAVENLTRGLSEVAPRVAENNTTLLLEALDTSQTDVVNTVDEAVAVVKAVNHPAISSMFDFHNTADETKPFEQIVRENFEYIEHVHIQEMDGSYLGAGTGAQDFLPAMRALKELGYDQWVSLEVFNFEPGAEKIATESMNTLQSMMAKL
ncbi:MAG: sugar phosphate isomerase/epimerase family protein [Acidobacteriota bacterium]